MNDLKALVTTYTLLYNLQLQITNSFYIHLERIYIPVEFRKKGIGSEILTQLYKIADKEKKIIVLSAERIDNTTTSVRRLKRFYKRFGFIENYGKHKNWDFKYNMYRLPK